MTIFVLNGFTALLMLAVTLLSGCNVTQLPPGAQAPDISNSRADEPVMFVGVADEEVITDSEQTARMTAERERIRIEVQNAQGPVQNSPDYNR